MQLYVRYLTVRCKVMNRLLNYDSGTTTTSSSGSDASSSSGSDGSAGAHPLLPLLEGADADADGDDDNPVIAALSPGSASLSLSDRSDST